MGIEYLEALAFVQHIVISLVSAWISVQLVSGKMPVADSCSSRNRKKKLRRALAAKKIN